MDIVKLFNSVVVASFMGSVLVLIILLAKSIFSKKLNCYFHYYIWILVIIKLLLPYSFQSNFSIYNAINVAIKDTKEVSSLNKALSFESPVHPNIKDVNTSYKVSRDKNTAIILDYNEYYLINIIGTIWLFGSLFMIFLVIHSNYRIKYLIRNSIDYPNDSFNNILASCIDTVKVNRKVKLIYTNSLTNPSLYGIINPTIIIPLKIAKNIDSDDFKYIVLHELSHLKRSDIFLNWIIALLQCIYWFNPIILYGLYKMKQDCEIACDHHVISYLKSFESVRYGDTLIRMIKLSNDRQWIPGATSLSKNKFEIKRRISMITKYKKLSLGGIVFGGSLIAFIGFIGLTNGIAKTDISNNISNNIDIKTTKNTNETVTKSFYITLTDNIEEITNTKVNLANTYPPLYLVISDDIKNMINELKNLGAVKISINGEQISERSEISPVGQFITINGNNQMMPYIIKAELNNNISVDSLLKDNSIVNGLKSRGIKVKIENLKL